MKCLSDLSVIAILILLGLVNCQRITKYNKEAYEKLHSQIPSVKQSCGEICDLSIQGKPGKYFDVIQKKVDCPALFSNPDIDAPSLFPNPPSKVPKWLEEDFTYQGRVEIDEVYYRFDAIDNTKDNPKLYNFSMPVIDLINEELDNNTFKGPYNTGDSSKVFRIMKQFLGIKDKHVLVIGSETPWIEVMALRLGAKHVTSIDYAHVKANDHPKLSAIHALDFFEMAKKNELPEIDIVISHSSIEHSGLGRYGDNLNPWGDLITMARVWCMMKPGSKALIGIPTGTKDVLEFNKGRKYGPLMLSHVFANWKQVYAEIKAADFYWAHSMFVLEK